jgi:hypothetical protein
MGSNDAYVTAFGGRYDNLRDRDYLSHQLLTRKRQRHCPAAPCRTVKHACAGSKGTPTAVLE